MKRTERHHLKENEFVHWVTELTEWYEANKNLALYGGVAIVLVAVAVGGTVVYRQNAASNANRMLAEAMVIAESPVMPPSAVEAGKAPIQAPGTYPTDKARLEAAAPKLLATAEMYPAQDAGLIARYRLAAALVAIGRNAEGIQRYNEVAEKSTGLYQVMAKMGIADAQITAGQYDQAITSLKVLAQQTTEETPVDGVLMQLGRAYKLAGKTEDARKTFKRVTEEFAQSPYAAVARAEMESLQTGSWPANDRCQTQAGRVIKDGAPRCRLATWRRTGSR